MKTTSPTTLFDAIAPRQREFERIVHHAVHQALVDLGDEVRELDWASLQAHLKAMRAQAEALSKAVSVQAPAKRAFPLLFSNAALRRKIASDPDDDPSAGGVPL